ncbi:MAG: hypothetical protein M3Y91_15730 [Actinomycetota bacterium]|nr:hypothetical protein [Actinomycetota bacterium]
MSAYRSPAVAALNTGWVVNWVLTERLRAVTWAPPGTTVWTGHGLAVISDASEMEFRALRVPTNHVSVAASGLDRRPSDAEMATVRADFDLLDAEEDNHSPGVARNLFLPLHLPRGTQGICDCKTDETVVVESDGYRWSQSSAAKDIPEKVWVPALREV